MWKNGVSYDSTFLVLSQQASGLEPIVSQAQLVEQSFALKQRGNTFTLTHVYSVRERHSGNVRTMTQTLKCC